VNTFYYEVLGVKPGAVLEEVKKAYRALVRRNHPDLFPPERKELQELKMVQINEAYTRVLDGFKDPGGAPLDEGETAQAERSGHTEGRPEGEVPWPGRASPESSSRTQVGFHRDLEYAYYKQGFEHFSKAVYGIKRIERRIGPRNDLYYLRRFSSSLAFLRKADTYFSNLLELFPESMWSYDARMKKRRIEYFNRLYRKILHNIESRMKKTRSPSG
jgi:curved DNA-binding protein CbpA